ncbi:MAG: RNA methyltransferase [Caulobacteraceae bacterium]|nr:RNA methyltransferase [Caulobacteraceae bacterium]
MVKAATALHLRRTRAETGRFLVEGLKSVTEGVQLGRRPRLLLYGDAAKDHPLLQAALTVADDSVLVSAAILAKVSRRDNPQAVVGVFDQVFADLRSLRPNEARCWIALDRIRDPGNLGTIVRTADATGCGGVILVGECCDPFGVEAVRATMGSIFATPIYRVEAGDFMAWRPAWPGTVAGAIVGGDADFRRGPYRSPTLLLMGNEQAGLPADLADLCDLRVGIPMRGRADSLNLAVATGIMVYAITA